MAMSLRSTDALFRRYCQTGDATALGVVFDRTAPELLRIAGWLCGNRADAEDLLQRTFLLAIEARSAFDPRQRALPWLSGILTNQARNLARDKARRALLAQEPAPVRRPEQAAQDAEFAAAVQGARAELGPPYREVLDLHLEQGLQAKEIAERLGRPAGTVRTQLMRAMHRLRHRLPSGFATGIAAAWMPDLATLTAMRTVVLAHAHATAEQMAVASGGIVATTAGLGGSALMTKKLIAVSGLLLLLALGVYAFWSPTTSSAVGPDSGGTIVASVQTNEFAPLPRDTGVLIRTAAQALPDNDPGFASIHVTIRWADTGAPAAGVNVRAMDPITRMPVLMRDAVSDTQGKVDLRHLRPGKWSLACSHRDPVHEVELRAGQRETLELLAQRTGTARGRVVDPDGLPVADAAIWCGHDGASGETFLATRSDASGQFTLPVIQSHSLFARKDGFESSAQESLKVENGSAPEIELRLRARGGGLRGAVVDTRGVPIAWARVLVGNHEPAFVAGSYTRPRGEEMVTGADGRFAAHGIGTEPTDVQAWATGHGFWKQSIRVAAGEQRDLTIRLDDAAVVHGQVRNEAGEPLAAAKVAFGEWILTWAYTLVITDEQGRFAIGDLPAGAAELRATKDGLKAVAKLELRAGERTEWNPVLGKGRTIGGTVVDAGGRSQGGIAVGFNERPWSYPRRWSTTSADGRFELTNVGDLPVDVVVRRENTTLRQLSGVQPGTSDLVITLSAADERTAFLRGRVLDAQQQPVRAHVYATPRNPRSLGTAGRPNDPLTGAFTCGPLHADSYDVQVRAKDLGCITIGCIDLAPHQDRTLDDVVFQPPGSATLTVFHVDGRRLDTIVNIYDASANDVAYAQLEQGSARFPALQPGRYSAIAELGRMDASAVFEIKSGAETEVTLQAVAATTVTLDLRAAPQPESIRVIVLRGDGSLVYSGQLSPSLMAQAPSRPSMSLQPGTYRVRCRANDGRSLEQDLKVTSEPADLILELPAK